MLKELKQSTFVQFVFVISITVSLGVIYLVDQYNYQQKRSSVQKVSSSYVSQIKNSLFHAFSATYPLSALIRTQQGNVAGFTRLATEMLPNYPGAASLQLQPDGIITHVVPLEGNEGAIGHNLLTSPDRNKEAFLARDTGKLTLAGPFELIQGGVGAAARLPIYLDTPGGKKFWGFSAVLIRFPDVLHSVELPTLVEEGIAYQLSRIHPNTGKIQIISSSEANILDNAEVFTIKVPNGEWTFHSSPIDGWRNIFTLVILSLSGLFFTFLTTFSAILITRLKNNHLQLEHIVVERTKSLNDNLKRLGFALSSAKQGWFDLNIQTGEILVSDEYAELLGYTPSEFHTNIQEWQESLHPDDQKLVSAIFQECSVTGNFKSMEYRRKDKGGSWIWLRSLGEVIERDSQNKPLRLIGIHSDISQQKKAELRDKARNHVLEQLLNDAPLPSILDSLVNGVEQECPSTLCSILLLEEKGSRLLMASAPSLPPFYNEAIDGIEIGHGVGSCGTAAFTQKRVIVEDIQTHPYWTSYKELATKANLGSCWSEPIIGAQNKILGTFAIYHHESKAPAEDDIKVIEFASQLAAIAIERSHASEQLNFMANYDALTQLPNRTLFADRFNQAVAHSKRTENMLAICFIDLDNFKPVNDNYGHDVGDKLLIDVAERIKATIREGDSASRQGGDEFTLLLQDIESFPQCHQLLTRVRHALSRPYLINEHTITITVSVGITLYPLDNEELDTLIRHADQAMYQAKLAGKNQQQFFNALNEQQVSQKQVRLREIRHALTNNEFCLYYQPKVNMRTGDVFGAEALIRWLHPEKGLIPPLDFLPLIEGTDLEIQLGHWVINEAMAQMDNWQQQGITLEVSINISSHHLQSAVFFDQLNEAMDRHPRVNSQNLQLEILESAALGDMNAISDIIKRCQNTLGVNVALDDFGTGYSALTHMKNLSANTIKIDQTFVRDLLDDPDDYSIIDGIIGLAKAFNREVIAEGVETNAHGLMLLIMGCDDAQGYGISRPLPADDLPIWLSNYTPNKEWLSYGQQNMTVQQQKLILLRLTTEHWFKSVNNDILTIEDSGLGQYFGKCHLGAWLARFEQEGTFHLTWLHELKKAHGAMFGLTNELVEKHQAGNVSAARQGLDELNIAYKKVLSILDKQADATPDS